MPTIKSEDGLTHGWDQSDTSEWHQDTNPTDAGAQLLGVIAVIIFAAAFAVVLIGGPSTAPIVVPGFVVGAVVYGCGAIVNRRNQR